MRFKTGFEGRKAASIGWIMFILMGGVTHIQLCYVVHQYFHKIQWRFLSTMPLHYFRYSRFQNLFKESF